MTNPQPTQADSPVTPDPPVTPEAGEEPARVSAATGSTGAGAGAEHADAAQPDPEVTNAGPDPEHAAADPEPTDLEPTDPEHALAAHADPQVTSAAAAAAHPGADADRAETDVAQAAPAIAPESAPAIASQAPGADDAASPPREPHGDRGTGQAVPALPAGHVGGGLAQRSTPARDYTDMAGTYAWPGSEAGQGDQPQPASRLRLPGGRRGAWLAAVAAVAVIVTAALVTVLNLPSAAGKTGPPDRHRARHDPATRPVVPLRLVQVSPAAGAAGVNGAAPIRVTFTTALGLGSPMPRLHPAIAGTWRRSGASVTFQPARGFRPRARVKLVIPGGSTGVRAAGGGLLPASVTVRFRVGWLHAARAGQLLAQLGYLPLTWAPAGGSGPAPLANANAQLSAAYAPPEGSYTWQPGYPAQLHRLWRPGRSSLVLQGAVMAFEADHGLALDGVIGPGVWRALLRAADLGQRNQHGYTYALAREKLPEMLTVWHNGAVILRHLTNTGIPVAPTTIGTAPVYLRYQSQIMRGRNPDGSKYADPVAWVAYFRGGEAVHFFPRYSYGSPQSLGCVELPWAPAKKIWPDMTFGTLVTVTAP